MTNTERIDQLEAEQRRITDLLVRVTGALVEMDQNQRKLAEHTSSLANSLQVLMRTLDTK